MIDHGEQVHTLEAAKALIAAQAATAKQPIAEAEDDEDDFIDDEIEAADGEEAAGEARVRARPGETSEGRRRCTPPPQAPPPPAWRTRWRAARTGGLR